MTAENSGSAWLTASAASPTTAGTSTAASSGSTTMRSTRRDRDIYPFNTADRSGICDDSGTHCLANGIRNGLRFNDTFAGFASSSAAAVRPYNPATVLPTGFTGALGRFQYLNGCQGLTPFTLTGAQLTNGSGNSGARLRPMASSASRTWCTIPDVQLGDHPQGRDAPGHEALWRPRSLRQLQLLQHSDLQQALAGQLHAERRRLAVPTSTSRVSSSRFTFARRVRRLLERPTRSPATCSGPAIASGCNAGNGTLNPNNPFAAAGNLALLSALPDRPRETTTDAKSYRGAIGAHGDFGDGFSYNVGATASKVTLDVTNKGYIFVQGLLDAVAQGTYNFVDQSANSQAAIDQVFPENSNRKTSKMWQVQGALAKDLIELPGGWLNVAVGAQYRHESLNNPSSNAPNTINPYARYYSVNAVGVKGSREHLVAVLRNRGADHRHRARQGFGIVMTIIRPVRRRSRRSSKPSGRSSRSSSSVAPCRVVSVPRTSTSPSSCRRLASSARRSTAGTRRSGFLRCARNEPGLL